ncbi:MAG: polyphosphate polymerase domain-containing protein, partial [Clostridia bacterium]|nr:polyphosphate polymerase domain-containing protein [Clostridia bacterium]
QLERVLDVIESRMEPDKFNVNRQVYTIRNIYFDTEDNQLIRNSLAKPRYKEKIRLRTYAGAGKDAKAFLEIKKKFNGLVNKRRTKMEAGEAMAFVENGGKIIYKPYMNPQVVKELSYMVSRYKLMPKVMISYDRLAYFEKGNPDLRISLDTNIRTRRDELNMNAGIYGRLLLPENIWLMEIKTAKAMPVWLTEMLAEEEIRRVSFSKYGTEYKNYLKEQESKYAESKRTINKKEKVEVKYA